MAYTPKTWQCGDTITADELNRMEHGIDEASQGGGTSEPLIVIPHFDAEANGERINKTWQEIWDATISGKQVLLVHDTSDEDDPQIYVRNLHALINENGNYEDGNYSVYFLDKQYTCQQPNDYPFYFYD